MGSKNRIDVNPFFTYIFAFIVAFAVYALNWSYLYPALSGWLIFFFIASFVVSGFLGLYFYKIGYFRYRPFDSKLNIKLFYTLIILGYIAEFVYSRAIPLFAILANTGFDYTEFGIPTFHVILVTFNGFFTIHMFNTYMATDNKKYLYICISLLIFPILIFSRGTFLVNLSSILFIYLFSTKRKKSRIYLMFTGLVLLILLLFGVLGNIRTKNQQNNSVVDDVNDLVMTMGGARPSFENSAVPKEYFWAYLYISSPLANLQYNIDNNNDYNYSLSNFIEYANTQLNFDFISKRITAMFDLKPLDIKLIGEQWVVATTYSYSYSYLGWLGIIITFCFFMGITSIYLIVLKPSNPYFATGIAILNSIMLFSIFDNMFAFSGLSFQLLYPLLMNLKIKLA